jgi:hypothetical protein
MIEYSTPNLKTVEDPIRARHNLTATRESIKQLLSGGTPDWCRFPEDYRQFVKESFAAEREQSLSQVAEYRHPDQILLTDAAPRKVNVIVTREFIRKLRNNGVKCFTVYNGMPGTAGLWACTPFSDEMKYMCYVQIPAMYEWSVMRLDNHNLPNGEDFRGWRTVLSQIIIKEVLTEKKAHEIFGRPVEAAVSRLYRRTMWNFRNGIGRSQ